MKAPNSDARVKAGESTCTLHNYVCMNVDMLISLAVHNSVKCQCMKIGVLAVYCLPVFNGRNSCYYSSFWQFKWGNYFARALITLKSGNDSCAGYSVYWMRMYTSLESEITRT